MIAHVLQFVSCDFLSRRVESVNAALKIGGDHARANRFDDPLVERSQVGQRPRRHGQLHIGSQLPLGQLRRQQANDQKRNVRKAQRLDGVRQCA